MNKKYISYRAVVLALLQSACAAVLAISGIRVLIGLGALAAASGTYAPARGLHADVIRIPMLALATVAALVNLYVLFRVWRLRSRAGDWRKREVTPKEKRSERWQFVLAIVTLLLVGLEIWTHPMVHKTGPPPAIPAAIIHT